MLKEEFGARYCENSGITKEFYDEWFITLSCACDYDGCEGWAAVRNSDDMIKDHMELYAPREVSNAQA